MTLARITGFRLVTADLDRLARFYAAIGFTIGERAPIAADELRLLGLRGAGERLAMRLGPSRVDLDRFDPPGRPYPADMTAADLAFQHLALVTDDAASAWARAEAAGAVPISRECPVTLPASSGGVTAVKFRDPEGHPLEFLEFPAGANSAWPGEGMLGIDHSALVVSNLKQSQSFYAAQGLVRGAATLNEGVAQADPTPTPTPAGTLRLSSNAWASRRTPSTRSASPGTPKQTRAKFRGAGDDAGPFGKAYTPGMYRTPRRRQWPTTGPVVPRSSPSGASSQTNIPPRGRV